MFLSNVSIGIYGDAVQSPRYRSAKLRTLLGAAERVLGPSAAASPLRIVGDRGPRYPQDDPRKDEPLELPDKPKHAAEHAKEAAAEHKQRIAPAAEKAEATLEERREKLHERRHEAEDGDVRWHHLAGRGPISGSAAIRSTADGRGHAPSPERRGAT